MWKKQSITPTPSSLQPPGFPVGSMGGERESERQGQKEKRGEGSSLSPINIISMGAQNGLCQQNTNLLPRGEHEDEREG